MCQVLAVQITYAHLLSSFMYLLQQCLGIFSAFTWTVSVKASLSSTGNSKFLASAAMLEA